MMKSVDEFDNYFEHLHKISPLGRAYKKLFSSPILYFCARRFGRGIVEIGSGTGSGILGAFPKNVRGFEIKPVAVEYCKASGLNVHLIKEGGDFPVADSTVSACVLDNVLEHIEDPKSTLDECYRITQEGGGLVVAVPGVRGFDSDPDHKVFYDAASLQELDERWLLQSLFSIPFLFRCEKLSKFVKQYCLVATYKKI